MRWHRRPRRTEPYDWAIECPELVGPDFWTVRLITPKVERCEERTAPFTDFLGARGRRSRAEVSVQ